VQISLRSSGAEDGYVAESSETSGVGGVVGAVGPDIHVGDHLSDRQFKGIVSFDTSVIPDGATITAATLRLRRSGVWGVNPFASFGACQIDVRTGAFGGNAALQSSDFEAAATAPVAGTLSNATATGEWSTGSLDALGLAAINKTGTTQLRVGFELDDNDNGVVDRILYTAGDDVDPLRRPELLVTFAQ
jgi:hypothetical protein